MDQISKPGPFGHGEGNQLWSLSVFIDNSIDDSQSIEIELNTLARSVGNHFVLFVKVVEES